MVKPQEIPLNILAVDDSDLALRTIKNILETHGCTVEEAVNATDALSIARKSHFDAVVIDQLLPGQTGLQLLRELRKVHKNQRAIIVSAIEPSDELRLQMAQLEAIFISKPNLSQLVDKMRVLLERESNPIKVFISYASPNYPEVNWIYRRLEDNGFVPWMAKRSVPLGHNWEEEIDNAIDEADFFLSCLSEIAVKRLGYLQNEIELAVKKHDHVGAPFILPLLLDKCNMPGEFVERSIQYIEMDENDEWWKRLERTLRSKRK